MTTSTAPAAASAAAPGPGIGTDPAAPPASPEAAQAALTALQADQATMRRWIDGDPDVSGRMSRLFAAAYPGQQAAPAADTRDQPPSSPSGYVAGVPAAALDDPAALELDQVTRAFAHAEGMGRGLYGLLAERAAEVGRTGGMDSTTVIAHLARDHGQAEAQRLVKMATVYLHGAVDRDPRLADLAAALAGDPYALVAIAQHANRTMGGR